MFNEILKISLSQNVIYLILSQMLILEHVRITTIFVYCNFIPGDTNLKSNNNPSIFPYILDFLTAYIS